MDNLGFQSMVLYVCSNTKYLTSVLINVIRPEANILIYLI
ncbi:MAG: hypothetical protein Edafosvirus4_29 [Edafosvirus sp.]|uniref:Uncharacterized protein n=1 Tax=Edafosvirus sp. TaxID=2487765 RepID=A0A3G4ZT33_9VIRU|nr:MAG: hypothetical protein Edafosvirus4_29 [Edafosvirus sp.]